MKVQLGLDITADAWLVTRDSPPDSWVQTLLDAGQLLWEKDGTNTYIRPTAGMGKMGTLSQMLVGNAGGAIGAGAVKAFVGDYLIHHDDGLYRAVNPKEFAKEYKTL